MWLFKKRGVKRLEEVVETEVIESDMFLKKISEAISDLERNKQLHLNVLRLESDLAHYKQEITWEVRDASPFQALISRVTRLLMKSILSAQKIETDAVAIKEKITKLRQAFLEDNEAHVLQEKEVAILEITLNLTDRIKQTIRQLQVISGYQAIKVKITFYQLGVWAENIPSQKYRDTLDVITKSKLNYLEGIFEADEEMQTVFRSLKEIKKSVEGLLKLAQEAEEEARTLLG